MKHKLSKRRMGFADWASIVGAGCSIALLVGHYVT